MRRQVATITSSSRNECPDQERNAAFVCGHYRAGARGNHFFAAQQVLIHLEHATIVSTAPERFALKNQGLAFQRAAAHSPNVLMIYGSSELLMPAAPERGNIFFRTAPTGFQLSPVGGGGANPLIMLQKVGALGSALRRKRLAFSLSPGWFCTAKPGTQGYKGNFSPMAATEMVFGNALDFGLKRDIAARMLQFPETLEQRPFLEFALSRLASGQLLDRVVFCALWPAGKIQTALFELEDHWAAVHHTQRQTKPPPRLQGETVDWPQLIAKASKARPGMLGTSNNLRASIGKSPPARVTSDSSAASKDHRHGSTLICSCVV